MGNLSTIISSDSAIVHPDNYVIFKKDPKELRKFFGLGKGDEEKILRMKIFFDAGELCIQ